MKKLITLVIVLSAFIGSAQRTMFGSQNNYVAPTSSTPPAIPPSLSAPVLVTTAVTAITLTTASSGGTITSDGGAAITTSGLVWDISTNPTIALTTKTTDGTSSGTFASSMSGLCEGGTYYVRAYATNSQGTSYGSNVTFTTSVATAASVVIGSQTWMDKNLDLVAYQNGDIIPQVTDATVWAALTTGAWCYFNNDPATEAVYGKLYNWYSVNDSRGLAPQGWHIPTNAEWTTLANTLGGATIAGGKMKATCTALWLSPLVDATGESGFKARASGFRYYQGGFYEHKKRALWWTATPVNSGHAYYIYIYNNSGSLGFSSEGNVDGFSVRVIAN